MSIELTKKNQLDLKRFIKLLKPFSICCGVVAIAGLAIYPLINNNLAEKVEDKVEEEKLEEKTQSKGIFSKIKNLFKK